MQVLLGIQSNAIKFTRKGGHVIINVEIYEQQNDNLEEGVVGESTARFLKITVEDSGVGIKA